MSYVAEDLSTYQGIVTTFLTFFAQSFFRSGTKKVWRFVTPADHNQEKEFEKLLALVGA